MMPITLPLGQALHLGVGRAPARPESNAKLGAAENAFSCRARACQPIPPGGPNASGLRGGQRRNTSRGSVPHSTSGPYRGRRATHPANSPPVAALRRVHAYKSGISCSGIRGSDCGARSSRRPAVASTEVAWGRRLSDPSGISGPRSRPAEVNVSQRSRLDHRRKSSTYCAAMSKTTGGQHHRRRRIDTPPRVARRQEPVAGTASGTAMNPPAWRAGEATTKARPCGATISARSPGNRAYRPRARRSSASIQLRPGQASRDTIPIPVIIGR